MPTEQKYVCRGCVPYIPKVPSELDNLFPQGTDNINLTKIGRDSTKMAGTR